MVLRQVNSDQAAAVAKVTAGMEGMLRGEVMRGHMRCGGEVRGEAGDDVAAVRGEGDGLAGFLLLAFWLRVPVNMDCGY